MAVEVTSGTILGANGEVVNRPAVLLTPKEASLLRQYKKFLQLHGLREALFCNDCWDLNLAHGCEASVTDQQIVILCRCKQRFFSGLTI